jgi:putative ABC transport system permease protein
MDNMIRDMIPYAIDNMRHRKMRSWLTMIGIFIGIAAVVALISLGQGLKTAINNQFEKLGTDKLYIQPKGGTGYTPVTFSSTDLDVVKRAHGVLDADGIFFKTDKLTWKSKNFYTYIYSVPLSDQNELWKETFYQQVITKGRELRKGDTFKVIVGPDLTTDKFDPPVEIGTKITIRDQVFDVVGVMEKMGDPTQDAGILMPEDTMREIYSEPTKVDAIGAKVAAGEDIYKVSDRVTKDLRRSRNLKEGKEDFLVQTPDDILQIFNTILDIVIGVLVGIAAISLIVGGIGIMNTMYTAVLERTREIGIMKSIGARNRDIFVIFLIESGLLGLLGGAIGVLLGMGTSKLVEFIVGIMLGPNYLSITFQPWLIFGALAFSFIVGSVSGVTPAWQASRMHPVDALSK